MDMVKFFPLFDLVLIFKDTFNEPVSFFLVGNGKYPIKSNAILRLPDKFLFEPKFFLKVFKLGEKIDDLVADAADSFNFSEILFYLCRRLVFYIVKVNDLIFDIKIKFTA